MDSAPRFEMFTGQARRAIWLAYQESQRLDHDYLSSEHLLAGLVREGSVEVVGVFRSQGVEPSELLDRLDAQLARIDSGPSVVAVGLTPRVRRALDAAVAWAERTGDGRVNPGDLLLGLIADPENSLRSFLDDLGFDVARAEAELRGAAAGPNRDTLVAAAGGSAARPDSTRIDPTPAQLAQLFSDSEPHVDLSYEASSINPAIAESDFQLFLTQGILAVTLGMAGGYIAYQSVDAMAAAAVVFALLACFRNSLLGLLAGATLGAIVAQRVQPANRAFDASIEALVPLVLVGGFLGSFVGNFWRRYCPKYLQPSESHQRPPGVV